GGCNARRTEARDDCQDCASEQGLHDFLPLFADVIGALFRENRRREDALGELYQQGPDCRILKSRKVASGGAHGAFRKMFGFPGERLLCDTFHGGGLYSYADALATGYRACSAGSGTRDRTSRYTPSCRRIASLRRAPSRETRFQAQVRV